MLLYIQCKYVVYIIICFFFFCTFIECTTSTCSSSLNPVQIFHDAPPSHARHDFRWEFRQVALVILFLFPFKQLTNLFRLRSGACFPCLFQNVPAKNRNAHWNNWIDERSIMVDHAFRDHPIKAIEYLRVLTKISRDSATRSDPPARRRGRSENVRVRPQSRRLCQWSRGQDL